MEKVKLKLSELTLDPEYASVIVDRWEKMTGEKAVKLEDGKVRKKDKIL